MKILTLTLIALLCTSCGASLFAHHTADEDGNVSYGIHINHDGDEESDDGIC